MKVGIGTIRSSFNGFDALGAAATDTKDLFLDTLELNFAGCRFFEANMAAPLHVILALNYDRT